MISEHLPASSRVALVSELAGLSLGPICVTIVIEQSPSLFANLVFPVGCVCVCARVSLCMYLCVCVSHTAGSTQVGDRFIRRAEQFPLTSTVCCFFFLIKGDAYVGLCWC